MISNVLQISILAKLNCSIEGARLSDIVVFAGLVSLSRNRWENPQKLTQLSSRSHPRHFVGKRTAQKKHHLRHHQRQPVEQQFSTQVVSGCLTFNNNVYMFIYSYITRITVNYNTPHLKSSKNQNRRAALGRPAMKLLVEGL